MSYILFLFKVFSDEKKLSLANDVLDGAKRTGANKHSIDDLKILFQVG